MSLTFPISHLSLKTGYHFLARYPHEKGTIHIFADRVNRLVAVLSSPNEISRPLQFYPPLKVSKGQISHVQNLLQPRNCFLHLDPYKGLSIYLKCLGGAKDGNGEASNIATEKSFEFNETEAEELKKAQKLYQDKDQAKIKEINPIKLIIDLENLIKGLTLLADHDICLPTCAYLAKVLHLTVDFLWMKLLVQEEKTIYSDTRKKDLLKKVGQLKTHLKERGLIADQAIWSLNAAQAGISMLPQKDEDYNLFSDMRGTFTDTLFPMLQGAVVGAVKPPNPLKLIKQAFEVYKSSQHASKAWYAELLYGRFLSINRRFFEELDPLFLDIELDEGTDLMVGRVEELTEIALYNEHRTIRLKAFEKIEDRCHKSVDSKIKKALIVSLVYLSELSQDEKVKTRASECLNRLQTKFKEELERYTLWVRKALPKGISSFEGAHGVPKLPENYVPRDHLNLKNAFSEANAKGENRIVLHGLPGSGKSTLAAAYAKSESDRFEWVYWLDGADFNQGIRVFAERLGCVKSGEEITNEQLDRRVESKLKAVKGTFLIVVDNYTDGDLNRFYPKGELIVLSRSGVEDLQTVEVGGFSPKEALELLQSQNLGLRTGDLEEIAKKLFYHPILIFFAEAHLRVSKMKGPEYLKLLETNISAYEDPLRAGALSMVLYHIVEPVIREIEATSPTAIEHLKIAALCGQAPIPRILLGIQKPLFQDLAGNELSPLLTCGLISEQDGSFTMHDLVRSAVLSSFKDPQEKERLLKVLGDRLESSWKFDAMELWTYPVGRSLIDHLKTFCDHGKDVQAVLPYLIRTKGKIVDFSLMTSDLSLKNLHSLLESGLRDSINYFGENSEETARYYYLEARLLSKYWDNKKDSEKCLSKALKILENKGLKNTLTFADCYTMLYEADETTDINVKYNYLKMIWDIYKDHLNERPFSFLMYSKFLQIICIKLGKVDLVHSIQEKIVGIDSKELEELLKGKYGKTFTLIGSLCNLDIGIVREQAISNIDQLADDIDQLADDIDQFSEITDEGNLWPRQIKLEVAGYLAMIGMAYTIHMEHLKAIEFLKKSLSIYETALRKGLVREVDLVEIYLSLMFMYGEQSEKNIFYSYERNVFKILRLEKNIAYYYKKKVLNILRDHDRPVPQHLFDQVNALEMGPEGDHQNAIQVLKGCLKKVIEMYGVKHPVVVNWLCRLYEVYKRTPSYADEMGKCFDMFIIIPQLMAPISLKFDFNGEDGEFYAENSLEIILGEVEPLFKLI